MARGNDRGRGSQRGNRGRRGGYRGGSGPGGKGTSGSTYIEDELDFSIQTFANGMSLRERLNTIFHRACSTE